MKWTLTLLSFLSFIGFNTAQQTLGLFTNGDNSYPGYALFSTSSEVVYLIDNCGNKVNSWQVGQRGYGPSYLLENGDLLKAGRVENSPFNAGGGAGSFEIYTWAGDLVWTAEYASTAYVTHHDIYPMENGNILAIAWELKTDEETLSVGRETIPNNGLWSETVIEIKPIGSNDYEIVWKWDIFDHLIQDINPALDNYGIVSENPQLLDVNKGILNASDWLHFNAIDYNKDLDQIILSSRSMNEIYIIDHSTSTEEAAGHTGGLSGKGGDLLFRWGNPDNYDQGTPIDQKLYGQHNARWINDNENSYGNITVFNNGAGIPEGVPYSSIIEIEPSLEGYNYTIENGRFLPEELSWEYKADPLQTFYSARISSAQRLPNDNTFINQGNGGRMFEVDINGNVVWEYYNPVSNNGPMPQGSINGSTDLFKAMKYGVYDPRLAGKDLSSQGPIEINPISNDCSLSSLEHTQNAHFTINNPVSDLLYIWSDSNSNEELEIYNLRGQKLFSFTIAGTTNIDLSTLESGLYVLRSKTNSYKFIKS